MSEDRPLEAMRDFPAPVLLVGEDGRVLDSNGRLEQALGEDVVGRELATMLDAASVAKWRRLLASSRDRGPFRRWEFSFTAGARPAVLAFTPVWNEQGEGLWLVDADLGSGDDTLYDVLSEANSELVNAQRELAKEKARVDRALAREEEARAAADAAVRLRDEVLAIVSHDLRSPIATIETSVGALLEFGDQLTDEGWTRQLEIIRRGGQRAIQLIEDLLDVARIESGHLAIDPAPIDLRALLEDLCSQYRGRAADTGITVECLAPDDLDEVVLDPHRIQQALANLLDNALRYTPEGGRVEVAVSTDDDLLRIVVRDEGPGIPPDEIEHLFERFWQARKARRGSAGLGLAIVRGIAEAHGGTVEVASEPGEGSAFTLVLPSARGS